MRRKGLFSDTATFQSPFPRYLAPVRFAPCRAVLGRRLVAEIPVDGVEELHGLLVHPHGVDDECEKRQAHEEDEELRQRDVQTQFGPVTPTHPPHVVHQHHAAVKHVDHQPLIHSPQEGTGPAGLREGEEGGGERMK